MIVETSQPTEILTVNRRPRTFTVMLLLLMFAVQIFVIPQAIAQTITDEDIAAIGRGAVDNPLDGESEIPGPPSLGGMLGRLIIALGVVFALMAGVLWAARRWLPRSVQPGRGGQIEVLATRSIGSRRNLILVRALGKTVLLGVTPQSIQTLTDFIDDEPVTWAAAADAAGIDVNEESAKQTGTTSMERRS